jgi:hypothetical protein
MSFSDISEIKQKNIHHGFCDIFLIKFPFIQKQIEFLKFDNKCSIFELSKAGKIKTTDKRLLQISNISNFFLPTTQFLEKTLF